MTNFDTVTIHYFSDGHSEAYWTESFDGGAPSLFSANRYATFHGLDGSDGRQVQGLHSTPLNYDDPRRYFLQRPGFSKRMEFNIVPSVEDLPV